MRQRLQDYQVITAFKKLPPSSFHEMSHNTGAFKHSMVALRVIEFSLVECRRTVKDNVVGIDGFNFLCYMCHRVS